MDGKLSATLSFFDMDLTNVAVLQAGISTITNQPFFIAAGSQTQKGWDATLSYAPTANWQIIATAYDGTVDDQNGRQLNNSYTSLYSFFTRYQFTDGSLKGLSIGGGGSKTGGNYFTTPGSYVFPVGVTPGPITMYQPLNANLFAAFQYGKNWTFRVSIENVLDKVFALGAQQPLFVDMSPPRNFQFSTSYKF
jgi:outer membrane receptor for ferric coprogen and ferric-rhodotorulic acid